MAGNAVIGALRVSLGLDTAEFDTGIKQVQSRLGGIGKAFGVLGGSAIFAGFIAGLGGAVQRLEETRKLSAQLDKALENTGNVARTSSREVEAFADRLERSTGRAAEEVLAVSTNLATFGFNNETFFRSLTLANDMAAAWGGDLKQNIEGLGRALAEPEKGLAMLVKRGITFDDQQKAQIANFMKVNDLAGAQGIIFEALEGQVKGVAEAGFGGITKASANAMKSIEDMFEAIAGGLRLGQGIEMLFTAAGAGIDLVTANLDTIGKVATVAGAAVAVAMGPAVWAAMTKAAAAFGTAASGAFTAIGKAIRANPIGFLISALAAAVTAVFVFRDNIRQAIGVDVAGIIIDVTNKIIGSFVGAFQAIGDVWGKLPAVLGDVTISTANAVISGIEAMINGAVQLINDMISGMRGALGAIGIEIGTIANVDFGEFENQWAGAIGDAGAAISEKMSEAMSADYIGDLGKLLFGEGGPEAIIQGFDNIAAGAEGAGGRISDAMKNALESLRQSLMTEEEAELASHQKRLAQIDEFYRAGAIKRAEYDDLLERAQTQHAERMTAIAQKQVEAESRVRSQLAGNVSSIFGSISSMLETFGDKNLAAAKGFAVAGAVVNTAEGITKALAQGGLLGFAGAAAVAASGAAQIATILSAGKGASSRPSVSSAKAIPAGASTNQSAQQSIYLNIKGSGQVSVDEFADQLQKSIADGGHKSLIKVIRQAD